MHSSYILATFRNIDDFGDRPALRLLAYMVGHGSSPRGLSEENQRDVNGSDT